MTDRYANIRAALGLLDSEDYCERAIGYSKLRNACAPDTIRALLAEMDSLRDALEAARVDAAEAKQNGYELGLLAAAREAAWQSIETCPNADRVVMFCDERQNIWTDCAWNMSAAATGFYATHWRPLPAPPAIDRARAKENGNG